MDNKINLDELEKLIRSAINDEEYWSPETRQAALDGFNLLVEDYKKLTKAGE